jgi:hypothetical protein
MDAERIAAALRYQQGLAAASESATPTDILGGQLSDESSVNRLLAALQHQEQWSTPAQQPAMTQQQQDQMSHTNSFGSGGEEFFAQQRRDREFDATEAQNLYERERYGRTLGGVEQSLEPFTGGTMEQNIRNTLPNVIGASVGGGGLSSGISAAKNNSLKGWAKLFGPQGMFSPNVPMSTLPMNVWHGSPHRFNNVDEANPMGQFDISKVGTGEGNQAYGHGIYNAESPDVAKGYQGSTTFADQKRSFLDVLPEDAEFDEVIELIGTGHFTPDQDRVLKALKADDWLGFDYPSQAISAAYSKNLNNWDPSSELVDAVKSAGHLYEVDLPDEDIAKMLDWDAPLSEQPESVRDAARKLGIDDSVHGEWTGQQFYEGEVRASTEFDGMDKGKAREAMSAKLNELGIPGIKYLDGDSRASGEGTRNFVSFDPTRVKILSRNGERAAPKNALVPEADQIVRRDGGVAQSAPKVDDYAGNHTPPMSNSGAPGHDLTGGGEVYPDDVYTHGRQYYGSGEPRMDSQTFSVIDSMKGRPNKQVTIYRAVPYEKTPTEQINVIEKQLAKYQARRIVPAEWGGSRTAIGDEQGFYDWATSEVDRLKTMPETGGEKFGINQGDWVTVNRAYAKDHGEGTLQGKYKIVSKKVYARDIFTNGDSPHEWGYDPQPHVPRQTAPLQMDIRGRK